MRLDRFKGQGMAEAAVFQQSEGPSMVYNIRYSEYIYIYMCGIWYVAHGIWEFPKNQGL